MQELVVDTARDFARDVLAPNAAAWDRDHVHPVNEIRQMGELGFYGMLVSEDWGENKKLLPLNWHEKRDWNSPSQA